MFTSKKDRLRHRLLLELVKVANSKSISQLPTTEMIAVLVSDLASILKATEKDLTQAAWKLHLNDEIQIADYGAGPCMYAWNNAESAYLEEKYLNEARKRFNDNAYDLIKWIVPIVLCAMALYGSIITRQELSNSKQEIKSLQQRISILEGRK